jgi:hypothetical protein
MTIDSSTILCIEVDHSYLTTNCLTIYEKHRGGLHAIKTFDNEDKG